MSVRTAIVVTLLTLPLQGSGCFAKECLDETYCVRECECTDSTRNTVTQCPIQFQCNVADQICDEAYNDLSCDEICTNYAARGLCGSKQCTTENECLRQTTCQAFDPGTGEQICSYNCDLLFACDADVNACEADYLLPDNELCQRCAESAGGNPCGV